MLEAMGTVAKALQVELQPIELGEPKEYDGAFSAWPTIKSAGS